MFGPWPSVTQREQDSGVQGTYLFSHVSSLCQKRSHLELTSETNSDLCLTQLTSEPFLFPDQAATASRLQPLTSGRMRAALKFYSHMMKMGFLTHNKTGEIALS